MRIAAVTRALRISEAPARQNSVGSFLIQASQRLSRLVAIIAAAAILSPESFAALAVALALTDLVRGALLAFDVGAVRLLSRGEPATDVVRTNLDAKALAGFAGTALAAALAVVLYDPTTLWLVLISAVGVLASAFGSTFLVVRQAALQLGTISPRVVVASVVSAVLAVLLVWVTRSSLGVVVGLTIGDAVLLGLVSGGYAPHRPDWRPAAALIRDRGHLLVMQLAYIGQFRVGTVVLAAGGSAVAVGEYSIASRIAEGLVILAAANTASSLPLMGGAHARDERDELFGIFGRSYSLGILVIGPTVAALVIAAPVWLAILFPRYPEAGPVFAVVGLAVIIFFASSQTTALLNAAHRDRAASRSAVTGLTITTVGSILLVSFGAVGVALARVAGELARLLVEAVAIVRDLGGRPRVLMWPWLAVAPVLAGAAVGVASDWGSPQVWAGALIVLVGAVGVAGMARRPSRSPA